MRPAWFPPARERPSTHPATSSSSWDRRSERCALPQRADPTPRRDERIRERWTMSRPRDPIGFELFKNTLLSIADEMALTILRTAYSGVLKDNMDYSTAFCDG